MQCMMNCSKLVLSNILVIRGMGEKFCSPMMKFQSYSQSSLLICELHKSFLALFLLFAR